jgi:hypothetical protein
VLYLLLSGAGPALDEIEFGAAIPDTQIAGVAR